jgi:hypothetical protein
MASAQQDSELQHSFGPGGVGFDFLPLDLAATSAPPLPTQPAYVLPMLDLASDSPLPDLEALATPVEAAPQRPEPPKQSVRVGGRSSKGRAAGEIWLDGGSIFCVCPDCKAPMSIRFWLMIADCWRCGASIELSEEQEREVQRLLAESQPKPAAAPPLAPPIAPTPRPAAQPAPALPPPVVEQRAAAPVAPVPPPPAAAPAPPPVAPAPPAPVAEKLPAPPAPPLPPPPPPAPPSPARQPQPPAPLPATREMPRPAARPAPPAPPAAPPAPGQRFKGPPPAPPVAPPRPAQRQRAKPGVKLRQESWAKHLLTETPAWLISMLVHMILLTILALFTVEPEPNEGPFITLSTVTAINKNDGGETIKIPPNELAKFDLPLPKKSDLLDDRKREALLAAAQDARELRLDDDAPPFLPDVEVIKQKVGTADGVTQGFLARDPRLRVEMVTKEGGTTLTEAAVARGLRWLANHQSTDGSWSLSGFHKVGDCNCNGAGSFSGKSPGTALAMLPFLGAGQSHLAGKYKGSVGRGLRWLVENQKENGDLRAGSNGNEGMYTHGQATIVLCEAFAMTGDEELRIPAQKAIDFIVAAQYRDGGWRYTPGPPTQRGDTSVVGWQLMALQSARAASLTVPEQTWSMADLYLDSVQHKGGSQYSYQARGGPTEVMTAEALLCRLYLGWNKERPGLSQGVHWLTDNHLPSERSPNIYYWYYGTQLLHHYGGADWEEWNVKMRDLLVNSQETGGHAAGSWAPRGQHAAPGGRIYVTSLSVCTLEVYYRHLPIFRQIELGK